MKSKKWFQTTLAVILSTASIVAALNFGMDPLWCFAHIHRLNYRQTGFNERQQKTNHIYFQPFDYDALLLGSSRTTFVNQKDFVGMNVYNYSAKGMMPHEYNGYIEFAKECNRQKFDTIILGLDYFGRIDTWESKGGADESAGVHIKNTTSFLYRYRTLLSISNVNHWFRSMKKVSQQRTFHYDRIENAARPKLITSDEVAVKVDLYVDLIRKGETEHADWPVYNRHYQHILVDLIKNNPKTRFLIYTTPLPTPVFAAMMDGNGFKAYSLWLGDIVDVFGEFINFMDINSVNDNYTETFCDTSHFRSDVGALIARRLSNPDDKTVPADFGKVVNTGNIDDYLKAVEESLKVWNQLSKKD